jgi:2'-hydroxyisoflavone reductase
MRVLIIGGSRFLGRCLAEAVLSRGHELVLFNRGQTNPGLFPQASHVRGDRHAGGLHRLAGTTFDAVFDTSAYHPADVLATAVLAPGIEHYALVSTVSVYRDPVPACADETAPRFTLSGAIPRQFSTPEEYGALKALCEDAASQIYGERALLVRPGLIIGPHDYTDRLTSWMRRIGSRKEVVAGDAAQPLQLVDVRDVADWMMRAAEARVAGVYNVVGPGSSMTFADFVVTIADATAEAARVVWTGDDFLQEREIALPLWIPRKDHAFFELSNARAVATGLTFRSLAETVADVQAWDDGRAGSDDPGPLPAAREDELLREWDALRHDI